MTQRVLSVLVLVALLAACSSPVAPPTAFVNSSAPTVSSRECGGAPQLQATIEAFLADYNAGRAGLADRFFAPEPLFQWYSEQSRRVNQAAYERSTLEDYLLARHADGDRLSLVALQFNGRSGDIGNFGFVLRRGSGDFESKGAIHCPSGKFIVWSLGPNPGPNP